MCEVAHSPRTLAGIDTNDGATWKFRIRACDPKVWLRVFVHVRDCNYAETAAGICANQNRVGSRLAVMFSGMFRRATPGGPGSKSATSSPARTAQQVRILLLSAPCACWQAVQAARQLQLQLSPCSVQ